MEFPVEVIRGNTHYFCKGEEQLKLFLSEGYTQKDVEKPSEPVKKATKKKREE